MSLVTYITILLAILNYIRLNDLKKKESPDLALIDAGALQTPYYGGLKQSYRFLTAGFVHMSFYHLFMNLYCMYYLGTSLEYILGHISYAILLVGSIILGNVFQALIGNDYTISGGLSSGIYGLLATELIFIYLLYGIGGITHNTSLLITIILNVSLNFMPGVSWKAHLGGATFGALFMAVIYYIL